LRHSFSKTSHDNKPLTAESLFADLFEKLWLMSQQQAQQGRLIPNAAYWSLVDKILQSRRFLNEGTPLNKDLLLHTLSSHYTALFK
jgi:hypothetical protein